MKQTMTIMELADENFDLIIQKLQQETMNMRSVARLFECSTRELEAFGRRMHGVLEAFKAAHKRLSGEDSWEAALDKAVKAVEEDVRTVAGTVSLLECKVMEPFDIFIQHYVQSNKGFLEEGSNIFNEIMLQRNNVKRIAEEVKKNIAENRVDEELNCEYKTLLGVLYRFIDENEQSYKSRIKFIMQNEENRIDFERKIFSKYVSIFEDLAKNFLANKASIDVALSSVRPSQSIEERKLQNGQTEFLLFEKNDYLEAKHQRKGSDATDSSAGVSALNISLVESILSDSDNEMLVNIELPEEDTKLLQSAFSKLIKGENIDQTVRQKLTELVQYADGRSKLSALLESVTHKISVPFDVFKTLSALVHSLLEAVAHYNDTRVSHLNAVLSFCFLVHTADPSRGAFQCYLREDACRNRMWTSKERWYGVIQHLIDKALGEREREKESDLPAKGFIKHLFAGENFKGGSEEETEKKSIVYSELQNAAVELGLMSVSRDTGRDILIHFALIYRLQQDMLFQLLTDYESSLALKREEARRERVLAEGRLEKRETLREKFGNSKLMQVIGMSLKFIDNKKLLRNILVVSKQWINTLKPCVYKVGLKNFGASKRYALWESILSTRGLDKLYLQLKSESLEDFKKTHANVDNLIRLDVSRSFHLYDESEQEVMRGDK